MNHRIEQTKKYLWEKLMESEYYKSHPADGEYRYEHSIRVANIGKTIAEKEGLNVENLVLGCLLHDVSYCMSFEEMGDWKNHGRYSARIARPFLLQLGLNQRDVEEICYGISIHVDDQSDFDGERTMLALSIGEADNIDRFDAYRIYDFLQYSKYSEKKLEEKRAFVEEYLHRLEELRKAPTASETGQRMWLAKLDFQEEFYNKLLEQIKNSSID